MRSQNSIVHLVAHLLLVRVIAITSESRSRSLEWNVDEECGESDKDRIVQDVFSTENTWKIIQNILIIM